MTPVETPQRQPIQHRASPSAIGVLSRLQKLFQVWPPVLPTEENPTIRPLAIGIDKALIARTVTPEGMTPDEVAGQVIRTIRYLTQAYAYHRSLAAAGAMRHDADGLPVEPVSARDAEHARSKLPGYVRPAVSVPDLHEVVPVKISALKVSLPLSPDQLRPVGETVKTVDLALDLGDGKPFIVAFSGKNYRRTLRQVDELLATGAEVIILLQGRLIAGGRIEGAGLSVQSRTPKPTA